VNEPLVQSMTSQLIGRLRDRILAGAYAPGSALRQDVLASEFGTSKIPVREALVQLQSEGLVDIFPNRGFQVRPLAATELEEVFRLRLQPVATEMLGRLHTLAQRYVQAHLQPEGRVKRALREHTALLRLWRMGKSKEVRALMHAHIESTRDDLRAGTGTGRPP
jgi:DNA-binding GntR family transcriptional regulator